MPIPFSGPITAFLIALIVGLVIDQVLFMFIRSRAAEQGWATGQQLAIGIHGLPTSAGLLTGSWLALRRLELPGKTEQVAWTVLEVLAILVATAFAARILGRIVRVITEREGSRLPSTSIFVNLSRGLVWVFGIVTLLGALGVSIAPLITALGVGGLAVGLALQPTLENVFSGIQVLASRQIEPGDLIRLETGEEGKVLDVTWRNTTILKPSNDVVIVPNSVIGRSRITNFSTIGAAHSFTLQVPVSLQADAETVEKIALDVAQSVVDDVPGIAPGFDPSVRFAQYAPPNAVLNITITVDGYPDRILARHELVKRLQRAFSEAGIEAPGGGAAPAPPA